MSVPFDATDLALHMQESEQHRTRTSARLEKIEQELHGHVQRTSGIWKDVRGIKWMIRLLIPLFLALAGAAPWVVRHVVRDALQDAGVVRTAPAWETAEHGNR
jgi:hypothetical protein